MANAPISRAGNLGQTVAEGLGDALTRRSAVTKIVQFVPAFVSRSRLI
jgi:hypothetical protein